MAVNMTAQSIAVKQNWVKSGDSYIGDQPEGIEDANEGTAKALSISLSTAGRIGFYVDYSELSAAGSHVFYVCRTHGTTGPVSVDYASSGDTHATVSGTLTWADGEADIKTITVPVSSSNLTTHDGLGLGEHRIVMTLSNPTNSAALQHGSNHTTAYGVVDNSSMIASDANAVFFDADAVSNGTGAQASPYNNIYDAVSNVGSKRYIYGKGTQAVGTSNSENLFGTSTYTLPMPPTRASESARVILRNWPGSTLTFNNSGARTDCSGFACNEDTYSYHTFKGFSVSGLDNSSGMLCAGIGYYYGTCSHITIEHVSVSGINGQTGSNNAAFSLWGVDGGKVWNCTSDDIQTAGSNTNGNTSGVLSYRGQNLSVQRLTASNSAQGVYQKLAPENQPTISVRFCNFDSTLENGVNYGEQGGVASGSRAHDYAIVQSNVFDGCKLFHWKTDIATEVSNKIHVSNNVFYGSASGVEGAIYSRLATNWIAYNNIFSGCRRELVDYEYTATYGDSFEYVDYNCSYGTTYSPEYSESGTNLTLAQMQANGFCINNITSDPGFTNPGSGDFTLQDSANAEGAGVDSTDMGLYLTGSEIVGAA